jgi:hypothetical protein
MTLASQARNARKFLKAAARLNADRGKMDDAYVLKKGQPIRFFPCERSLVFLAALYPPTGGGRPDALREAVYASVNNDTPGEAVLETAYMTRCSCHPLIRLDALRALEYDDADATP